MFTPRQVSDMLGIPDSTLRRYARIFSAHLSDQSGRIRRLYTERDILIFSKVHEHSKLNQPFDQLEPLLEVIEAQPPEAKSTALSLIPEIAAEIEAAQAAAASALSQLASQQMTMLQHSDQLANLSDQLAAQLAALDAINKYLSLPWWKRLFIRPPHV